MNKKLLIIFIMVIIIIFSLSRNQTVGNLVSPMLSLPKLKQSVSPTSTPAPPAAPATFKFDRSTDLKKELEKINPAVLDSDFTI